MKQLYQLEVYCYLILSNNKWVTLYSNTEQAAGLRGLKTLHKLFDENYREVRECMVKNYVNEKEKHYRITLSILEINEESGLLINSKTLKGIKR